MQVERGDSIDFFVQRDAGRRAVSRSRLGRLGVALVTSLLVASAGPASAADDATVVRLRAEGLAAKGRCDEALPLLAQARMADPSDARAALVAGQCQLRLKRYNEAVESLKEARRLAPNDGEAQLYLGMALFHQGDLAGAREALEAAQTRVGDRPELDLYLGLLALERADSAEAQARLARASRRADLDPISNYYGGLAEAAAGERRKAGASLQRVIDKYPGTPWAEEAQHRLTAIRDTRPERWWVEVTVGGEYDTNVVLQGQGVQLPSEISSSNDDRFMWSAQAGYELLKTPDWTVGVLGTYYGTTHGDLENFDTHFPGVSLWADRTLGEGDLARLQYDFGYAWVGGNQPYVAVNTVTPAWYHTWGAAGITRAYGVFEQRNYFSANVDTPDGPGVPGAACLSPTDVICGPAGLDEEAERNRDGMGWALGFEHTLPLLTGFGPRQADPNPAPSFRNARFFLRGGYEFHHYGSRGTEYTYDGHEVWLGGRVELPYLLALEANAHYEWRPYDNRSTYPDPSHLVFNREYPLGNNARQDNLVSAEVMVERPITDELTASARYIYYNEASNVDVFDYHREIMGLYLTYRFAP